MYDIDGPNMTSGPMDEFRYHQKAFEVKSGEAQPSVLLTSAHLADDMCCDLGQSSHAIAQRLICWSVDTIENAPEWREIR